MTWQHELLVAEGFLSALVAVVIVSVYGGRVTYTPAVTAASAAWNASVLWLLLAGATHSAWQYWLLGGVSTWALLTGLGRGLRRETNRAAAGVSIGGMAFAGTLIAVGQTLLLVTA